jgi:hypothetical protein
MIVSEAEGADDGHVLAVFGPPTCEHDMVELVALSS